MSQISNRAPRTRWTTNTWQRCWVAAAALAIAGCTDGSAAGPSTTVAPSLAPSSATAEIHETELTMNVDAAISPSGQARVAFDERGWCLETDAPTEIVCVEAAAEGSASDGIIWRPDERAVAITWGRQDPMSIIDFDTGNVTETSLREHRFLAWSPDGDALLGLAIDVDMRYSLLDPETLDATEFADFEGPGVPRLFWISDDLIIGSSTSGPAVFVLDQDSGSERVISGGLGEQDVRSLSADGSVAIATDNEVERGMGDDDDPAVLLFDVVGDRSSGLTLPADFDLDDAQLSADGKQLLVVGRTGDDQALITGTIDDATLDVPAWTELLRWPPGAEGAPASFVANGTLRWTGGDTAWVITEDEGLARISLS